MKLVLDTHVFLWAASDPDVLHDDAREALVDPENEVCVSAVTAWEIAIKQSLGKLTLARPASQWVRDVIRKSGFQAIEVSLDDALRVGSLPWHHRDPFDRLLVAQALERGYTVATRDAAFEAYGVGVLRV